MDLGIIGLARSGKTSLFNAVTRGQAQVGAYSSQQEPNVGIARVPDERVFELLEAGRAIIARQLAEQQAMLRELEPS